MMQHIAVVRPEIAASSVETGKAGMSSRQPEGFSRHLQQHQRADSQETQNRNEPQTRQRRVDADNKVQQQSTARSAGDNTTTERRSQSANKATDAEPKEASLQADKSVSGTDTKATKDGAKSNADNPPSQVAEKRPGKGAENDISKDKEPDSSIETEGEQDKQAEQWLALVHKLVNQAQTGKAAGDAENADKLEQSTDQSDNELSDKHKAVLEQLGLDAEKVWQQAGANGKLEELKALLQGTADNDENGDNTLALEQVLALLLTDKKGAADEGDRIAQNHALGLKSAGEPTKQTTSSKSELTNERLLDYQQRLDETSQRDKDVISLLKKGSEEARPAIASTTTEKRDNGDRLTSATAAKDSKEANALQQLARLPEPALDKALQNLTERLPLKDAEPTVINSFIDNLKAGIEEFKQQRSQGREPGLDLQSLVSRVWSGEGDVQQSQQQSVLLAVKQFGESLSAAASTIRSEINPAFTVSAATERLAGQDMHVVSETTKTASSAVMERAVNITRPEAAGQLAERVRMLVNQGNMSADIRLDPPDLGSMQIRISMNGEQASVNFVVQSQQARDMLDQAVPRLREMLAERGIELGQSSVEQQQKDGNSGDPERQGQMASAETEQELMGQQAEQGQEIRLANGALGGIDYFV